MAQQSSLTQALFIVKSIHLCLLSVVFALCACHNGFFTTCMIIPFPVLISHIYFLILLVTFDVSSHQWDWWKLYQSLSSQTTLMSQEVKLVLAYNWHWWVVNISCPSCTRMYTLYTCCLFYVVFVCVKWFFNTAHANSISCHNVTFRFLLILLVTFDVSSPQVR